MSHLDQIIDDAVECQAAPFIVAMVADRQGVRWQHSAGRANAVHAAGPDTVFALFSMTKAIGSLMAVIAIDRGLVTIDTPVGEILPEFDKLQVLEGMGPDGPIYRKPKTRGTLRHLLTHTVGMGYEAFYPLMAEYATTTGAPSDVTGTLESLNYPLLFDPGEAFAYGIGTDWVGALVSELDGRSIDRFVREEILQPLGMTSTLFERAEAGDILADQFLKNSDGQFEPAQLFPAAEPEIYHMGNGLYGSAPDYLAFLRFVLNRGELNGQRIAGPDAMQLMYTDQLRGVPLPSPILKSSAPHMCKDVEPCPGMRKTHTAAFFRNEDSLPGMRGVGSLSWAGVLNTHYWIDPARELAAVFMTQMLPFYDTDFMACFEKFERSVYQQFNS
jgi:CubicO group peptidase (beta-lactamase class C family)